MSVQSWANERIDALRYQPKEGGDRNFVKIMLWTRKGGVQRVQQSCTE